MDLAKRLQVLQAADGDPALLALVTVDLAYPDVLAEERELIKRALLASAVPHWCDPAFLVALLGVDVSEAERLHDRLCALTVIELFPARGLRALNVHESARLVLREHLRLNNPEQWQNLASRARAHVAASCSVHARIEALHHLFAIDQEAAAAECESLDRDLRQNLEWMQALAVSLNEIAAMGWLRGSALVQALLIPLQVRCLRGESSSLEPEVCALVELAAANPFTSSLANAHCLLGDVFVSQGRLDAALSSFKDALSSIERLAQGDPSNTSWQRDLAVAQARLGDVCVSQGRLDAALSSYKDALSIHERLAQGEPSNASWQRDLAVIQTRLGDVCVSQGRLDAALSSYKDALSIHERLAQGEPSNASWQRDLAVIQTRLGDVCVSQGRLDAALSSFKDALSIHERLAQGDPSNTSWQRDLAVAQSRLGGVFENQGRLDAALSSYKDALSINERLAQADPSNASWQRALAVAKTNLGVVFESKGWLDAALSSYKDALSINERLAQADPSNASWRNALQAVKSRLQGIRKLQSRQRNRNGFGPKEPHGRKRPKGGR